MAFKEVDVNLNIPKSSVEEDREKVLQSKDQLVFHDQAKLIYVQPQFDFRFWGLVGLRGRALNKAFN